jgi:4-amino-4-deoxy-L-arabinose transferase-like glycosyltransferase
MGDMPRFRFPDLALLLVVLAAAGGARAWYLMTCTNNGQDAPPFQVQDSPPQVDHKPGTQLRGKTNPNELDALAHNIQEYRWFGSLAPLAYEDKEEKTAHVAPGYPWLLGIAGSYLSEPDRIIRWGQCILGAVTAGCYFFFARRAFRNNLVPFLAGLFCALHPFWIINTGEINDGVLVTFLLAFALALGTRGSQLSAPFTSLLFGLVLAGLAMVRAALLPFAAVALLWFLLRCRKLTKGWFSALLAFLGFANGLAPWAVRNFQEFRTPVPVADSAFWHLWLGNNPLASGGKLDEKTAWQVLQKNKRLDELRGEKNQAKRYAMLGRDVIEEVVHNPANTIGRRLWAGLYFVFGEAWFREKPLLLESTSQTRTDLPSWFVDMVPGLLQGSLLAMLLLGFLGWRWTYGWRKQSRIATLAILWVPLPYLLSHADFLSGPRLPLDGILLCYSAFVLVCLVPGMGQLLSKGPGKVENPQT